ncbi:MAG: ketoacyl-ACP synthase III [Alphaproteobacteria bacterium]|uniref:Beta-ketoacyl-[acyl-carrier-protein] synthase III n=1 Tax=Candidatus Nitrobium versatile TaxID=2884831 RepID=A0A953M0S9_9BACT|nr:ketoacyl-ACP synthase III [Candidatus Nitrobium versatile]
MVKARIIATGSYVPEKVLTNHDLEKMVDTSDEWITERSGIKERRIAAKGQTASDLACEASKAALKQAGLKGGDIDMIIVATVSGDMPFPSTACLLQKRLDAKKAAGFDVNAACSGFLYALSVGESFIKSGAHKRVLVVGTEVLSKFVDWEDRTTCVLFGDGAGAVVLEAATGDSGILSTHLHSDGNLWELLNIPGGGSKNPPSKDTVKEGLHCIKMKGNETFKVAVRTLEALATETLKHNKLKPAQLTAFIPHQANLRIIKATAERLSLPMDKVVVNLDRYGNTSAASIPIALDEAVRTGRIRTGDYVLLEAFGGGLTWASALIRW